ncbi:MAG: periplasmic heavy metal sensor [Candidatus Margulisiibacteriota bacterium]
MIKKGLLILTVIAIMAPMGFAFQPPPGGRGLSAGKMIERIAKEIGLSQEQKEKYLAGAKQVEEEAKAIRAKNKDLFDLIKKELQKDAPDSKSIYGYMQQINQNELQVQFKRMEQIIAMKKELTPEQKAKLDQLMKDRQENKKKHDKK